MNAARLALLMAATVFSGGVQSPGDQENYFMVMFAYEGVPNVARAAHTFATFVKTNGDGTKPAEKMEVRTISWLPASLDVGLLRPPEVGRNLDLKTTLDHAKATRARVYAWGPYRIQKQLYERALKQVRRLERGEVAYKAVDTRFRPAVAVNCFHAISDMIDDAPPLNTGLAFGIPASRMVLEHLSDGIINPQQTYEWLNARLGLDKATITYLSRQQGGQTVQRPAKGN